MSHANPEDNEFALWLSLQLAKEGYPVWCDLTKLLCGEMFWDDIQDAIGNRAIKFIFAVSRHSNEKEGTKNELQCAVTTEKKHKLNDFILPVAIDDLPVDQYYILLQRRNVRSFREGWPQGLARLLDKLEKDGVPKKLNFNPENVSRWWREQFHKDQREVEEPETYLSNYFRIAGLPENLFLHRVYLPISHSSESRRREYARSLPYPAVLHGDHIISFADTDTFSKENSDILYEKSKISVSTRDFMAGRSPQVPHFDIARNIVNNILTMAWDNHMKGKAVPYYEMADRGRCYYFMEKLSPMKQLPFKDLDGKKKRKALLGISTRKSFKNNEITSAMRFWHFGIQAKPILSPALAYAMRYHVLFSDDGTTIWQDKDMMHRTRRSLCADWWNDDWRDRLLAFMNLIGSGDETFRLAMGPDVWIEVASFPEVFRSPVSYRQPEKPLRLDEGVVDLDAENSEEMEDEEGLYTEEETGTQGDTESLGVSGEKDV